jgi:rhodanese-related sulfurtransferase
LAITAAASLANTLYQMGEQFGLVSNGRDAVDRIRTEGWIGDWRTREQAQKSAAMNAKSDRLRPVVVKTQKSPDQLQKVLLSLAQLEKTDGLRLPQLVLEAADQMPRDATVIVLVCQITIETAIALGSLKKQGYAVTAIVNSHNHEAYAHVSSLLLAEGIETRHLRDEASIQTICQKQAYRV